MTNKENNITNVNGRLACLHGTKSPHGSSDQQVNDQTHNENNVEAEKKSI